MNREFYKKVIKKNIIDINDSILVLAGGENDFHILRELKLYLIKNLNPNLF